MENDKFTYEATKVNIKSNFFNRRNNFYSLILLS